VRGTCLLAHIDVATVRTVGRPCNLLLVLRRVVLKSGLGRAVDVASYAHSLIDLASDVPGGMVGADGMVAHARYRVANAVYRDTAEHL